MELRLRDYSSPDLIGPELTLFHDKAPSLVGPLGYVSGQEFQAPHTQCVWGEEEDIFFGTGGLAECRDGKLCLLGQSRYKRIPCWVLGGVVARGMVRSSPRPALSSV